MSGILNSYFVRTHKKANLGNILAFGWWNLGILGKVVAQPILTGNYNISDFELKK